MVGATVSWGPCLRYLGTAGCVVILTFVAAPSTPSLGQSNVETHGTGTSMGDPIEIQALTQAFRATTQRKGFCAIGSLKGAVGHLDVAAGVAGLIKTVLALEHGRMPPSAGFEQPNPRIDFANSPVYVNRTLTPWRARGRPRRRTRF